MSETAKPPFTQSDLQKIIYCDGQRYFWRKRPREMFKSTAAWTAWNKKYAGLETMATVNQTGYCQVALFNKIYRAHRVAWLFHTGDWPTGVIDHINGIKTDNRIENLRDVSIAENCKNAAIPKRNSSGVSGVFWCDYARSWKAYIGISGKRKHLGYFKNKEDAVSARKAAEVEVGYHQNHGRPTFQQENSDAAE